jgi:cytolysin (calcineurin-like family phosphatase)
MFTIAAATSTLKAKLIGQAFRRFLDGECDKATLRRTIDAIGQALAEDLHELVGSGADALNDATYERLASLGLVTGGPSNLTDNGGAVVATPLGALLL